MARLEQAAGRMEWNFCSLAESLNFEKFEEAGHLAGMEVSLLLCSPIPLEEYSRMFHVYSEAVHQRNEGKDIQEVLGWALLSLDRPELAISKDGEIVAHNIKAVYTAPHGALEERHIGGIEGFSIGAFAPLLQLVDHGSSIRHRVLTAAGYAA